MSNQTGQKKKDDSEKGNQFDELIVSFTSINEIAKDFDTLYDRVNIISQVYSNHIDYVKTFKILAEQKSISGENDWKDRFNQDILDVLNKFNSEFLGLKEENSSKGVKSKSTDNIKTKKKNDLLNDSLKFQEMMVSVKNFRDLFDDIEGGGTDKDSFNEYLNSIRKKCSIDELIIKKQDNFDEELLKKLINLCSEIKLFLEELIDHKHNSFFNDLDEYQKSSIDFLKNIKQYNEDRLIINDEIDDENIRFLFEKNSLDVGSMENDDIHDLLEVLDAKFSEVRKNLILQIK